MKSTQTTFSRRTAPGLASQIHEMECATTDLVALAELWRDVGPPDDDSNAQVYLWGRFIEHVSELQAGLELVFERQRESAGRS